MIKNNDNTVVLDSETYNKLLIKSKKLDVIKTICDKEQYRNSDIINLALQTILKKE